MDNIDYKILKILQDNARETASNIGKKIHLSVSAVIERIHKMEESGLIRGYMVVVDDKLADNILTVLMEVRLDNPSYYDSFEREVNAIDSIVSAYYKTGDFDFIIKLSCRNTDELENFHRKIMNMDGVVNTRTNIVLKTMKNTYTAIPEPSGL